MYYSLSQIYSNYLSRLGSLTKFLLFMLFTAIYIYVAIHSMPSRNVKRPTTSKNRNITSKIMRQIEENGVDLYAIEEEMALRREQIYTTCQTYKYENILPNTWEFVVDAHHSLVWCKVFKAASSTWIYYFNILGGYEESYLRKGTYNPLKLLRSRFPRPTLSQLNAVLHSSLSFLIVREPLERLLSIYQSLKSSLKDKYNSELINKIKKHTFDDGNLSINDLTFKQFVKYVIESNIDEKPWTPLYKCCAPCTVNFTVIAKLETLLEDQEYIIKRAGIEDILNTAKVKLQYLAHKKVEHTSDYLELYYSELDFKLLNKLVEIYSVDYEMFQYNATKYYNYIRY
ncbi:carbohydrate sulfotransferase 11-like [Rhodnius prolixus]|uniref:Carbohydrate sulfotransferase n=1 Tax=Rhodnius prolixus TaxID=13249 RepID=T1HB44_RHOPR